ncbi:hypothetical protein BC936DRAFT_147134 [Jimgerdemannia flammicorona]|uniref:Uncharacterized protein n=1 Tax=Jimgerdemannia flammicorona TaxID=994334 RepID=A0A433D605_9FUNG|nr:hypothetical protein BC936DRAFT_147134 [Jimgerdemannia flammicorona]
MREDLYEAVRATVRNTPVDTLKPEDARLLTKIELDFRRNGLHLPKEQRDRIKELKQRHSDLKIEFQRNLNQESSTVKFTREELEGMDEDFLGGLKKETGDDGVERFILTMKYPGIVFMGFSKNGSTRNLAHEPDKLNTG